MLDEDEIENTNVSSIVPQENSFATPSEWNNPFFDIDESDPYYDAVHFVCENNLFNGVSSTRFAPYTNMNRAMFVTVIGRLADVDTFSYLGESCFKDVVLNQWYTPYVSWASEYSIVNGYSSTIFGISDDITVEQAVTMLSRFAEYMDYDVYADEDLCDYSDVNTVSAWAKNAMAWAVEKGIYNCSSFLNPKEKASRALIAEMMYNFTYVFK